jgi:hypothetical protein
MTWWIDLWFWVLAVVSVAFGCMAAVVTVLGARDLVALFASLRKRHESGRGRNSPG